MINIMKKNDMKNFKLLKSKVINNINNEDYDDYIYNFTKENDMFA